MCFSALVVVVAGRRRRGHGHLLNQVSVELVRQQRSQQPHSLLTETGEWLLDVLCPASSSNGRSSVLRLTQASSCLGRVSSPVESGWAGGESLVDYVGEGREGQTLSQRLGLCTPCSPLQDLSAPPEDTQRGPESSL